MQSSFLKRRAAPAGRADAPVMHGPRGVVGVITVVLGLVIVGAGCDESSGGVSGRPPDSGFDGVPIVNNVEDAGLVAEWGVGDPLRAGALEGEAAFGRVADVAPRQAGGFWVLDAQSRSISGFDENGTRTVEFGGEGDGPGELRTPSRVFQTADGTVYVGSAFPPELHRFEADGSFLGIARLTESRDAAGNPLPARFAGWQVAPDGRLLADLFAVPGPRQGPSVAHDLVSFEGDLDRARRDTIARWSVPSTPASPSSPIEIVPVRPSWSVGPQGLTWWTPGTPYEIRAYDEAGTPVRAIRLERDAIRVTPRVEEMLIAGLRASAADGPGGAAVVEQVIERARWPGSLPHVAELWVSHPDGRLFALPWSADSFEASSAKQVDVFESGGRYAARLTLPPGFSARRFADGFVYGVERDELGIQYAVRYTIGPRD
ncbi:MAG: hypothetical protein M8841_01090 [marine benthic group bacterium]|nr:hypothetical protein [Gemmatimonadota bacterium]